ncbi:orotidine-5'-phosphate decarboxylase [Tumebacillus permanentifrigoris]|uniref:Orotidine 5'-phosphate decarboxylase n=1 Tax=Tumebacillus permanentifrigoris TaxID=378543 RepID=A0A316D9F2_9BACL|nr:orotidine-5'-phosphate decarboxylase [Tumebacillus permanentifrigoris]PWK12858.1 orotidine-5'-phosphate decarboxylase [Tumebacillus permanentifrigoris]
MTVPNLLRPEEKIFVALDTDNMDEALRLADQLGDTIRTMKVGLQLFFKSGPVILDRLHERGFQVFMDCKFHDIPNTVAGASDSVTSHGVYMFNVHVGGGVEMMRRAKQAAVLRAEKLGIAVPKVIGVTQLTSTSQGVLNEEIGIPGDIRDCVLQYARLAQQAGLDGVVASGHEIQAIREACGPDFLTVIPGIRPTWAAANDQARIMTPTDALRAGADYLVIGRAITHAADPRAAALRILEEVQASEGAVQ